MKNKFYFLFLFLLCSIRIAWAGDSKLHDVYGEATVYLEGDMTPAVAKAEALRQARAKALADKFGLFVSSTDQTYGDVSNGKSYSRFSTYALSEVKGVWVKNTEEPTIIQGYDEKTNRMWFHAKVKGKARALDDAKIDVKVNLLRNSSDDTHATTEFKAGDRLQVSIKTSDNGYLAIYALDNNTNKAYRVIPLMNSESHQPVSIFANKRYLFMNGDDIYTLTCESEHIDYMKFYVLFSPKLFNLPTDEKGTKLDSEELDDLPAYKQYEYNWLSNIPAGVLDKWMSSLRVHNEQMQCIPIDISIKRNN